MAYTFEQCRKSAGFLRERAGFVPEAALVLGSGLSRIAGEVTAGAVIPYEEIPSFPRSTAPGHEGKLIAGEWMGRKVAVLSGRFHCYEGYSMAEAAYYVPVLRMWGCERLILTNAAGSIHPENPPGTLMLLSDHLKLAPESPLTGSNDGRLGPRFFDMTEAYDPGLRELALKKARETGVVLREGVYVYFAGPQYETPAEIRMAALLGGSAVGMSTVPEAIAAAHCGMRVLAISCLSNLAAGVGSDKLSAEEVNASAERASGDFIRLLRAVLEDI